MMITAEIAREKAQLLGKIEQEIITAAESGHLDTITKDIYTDNEFKTISIVLTQAGFLYTKAERKYYSKKKKKNGIPVYNIFISWGRKQVTPR